MDPASGCWHSVEVGYNVDVSEMLTFSIFKATYNHGDDLWIGVI